MSWNIHIKSCAVWQRHQKAKDAASIVTQCWSCNGHRCVLVPRLRKYLGRMTQQYWRLGIVYADAGCAASEIAGIIQRHHLDMCHADGEIEDGAELTWT